MSLVRVISRGDRSTPANPAADAETKRELSGDGEESMSSPPGLKELGDTDDRDRPGSGSANRAERNERRSEVKDESSKE